MIVYEIKVLFFKIISSKIKIKIKTANLRTMHVWIERRKKST